MKTNITTTRVASVLLSTLTGGLLVSCATVEHPLARHDMDRNGSISRREYQQSHMQYNLASRQRVDEYNRARLATAHMDNVGDFIGEARQAAYLIKNFAP